MGTDMVSGYIYILESDATDNINWVPTVDNVILAALYTEGTEYCKIKIPKRWRKSFNTGIIVTDSGGGSSYDLRSSRRAYQMLTEGILTSVANAEIIEKFLMSDRHTSGSSTVFKRYYLILKTGAASYVQFMDGTSTMRDYCKGAVTHGAITWSERDPQVATVQLNWRSIW